MPEHFSWSPQYELYLPEETRSHEEIVNDAVEKLIKIFEHQTYDPPKGDPYIAGFAMAMHRELMAEKRDDGYEAEEIKAIVRDGLSMRLLLGKSLNASATATLLRACFQKQILYEQENLPLKEWRYSKQKFPWHDTDKIHSSHLWRNTIRSVVADKETTTDKRRAGLGLGELLSDLELKDVCTNKRERYKSLKLPLAIMDEIGTLPPYPRVLNVGCSRNLGLKGWDEEYSEVDIVHNAPGGNFDSLIENPSELRQSLSAAANYLLAKKIPLGPSCGNDVWSMRDEGMKRFARVCSFYPTELQPDQLLAYDTLDALNVEGVDFVEANLISERPEELERRKFDIITFVTMMHQLTPNNRANLLNSSLRYLDSEGPKKVFIVDFAKKDPGAPGGIQFLDDWRGEPFPYRVIMLDFCQKNPEPTELIYWTNGRCDQGAIAGDIEKLLSTK